MRRTTVTTDTRTALTPYITGTTVIPTVSTRHTMATITMQRPTIRPTTTTIGIAQAISRLITATRVATGTPKIFACL